MKEHEKYVSINVFIQPLPWESLSIILSHIPRLESVSLMPMAT